MKSTIIWLHCDIKFNWGLYEGYEKYRTIWTENAG